MTRGLRARRRRWGIAGLVAAAMAGCALGGRPVEREIVWQGDVTVRGSVVVAVGERLVIQPGTRVVFAFVDENGDGEGDSRISVQGSIEARGRVDAPVSFSPERPGREGAAGWGEILIEDAARAEFASCRFVGAQQAVHAHRTALVVDGCGFEGNGMGLRFTGDPVVVRGSHFVANGTAVRYWGSSPEIVANSFQGNGTAVFVREGSERTVLKGNNFFSSADYHVKLGESQAVDVEARGNWWGTDRPGEIERLLFDREDADYLGRVRYDPPAPGPLPTTAP